MRNSKWLRRKFCEEFFKVTYSIKNDSTSFLRKVNSTENFGLNRIKGGRKKDSTITNMDQFPEKNKQQTNLHFYSEKNHENLNFHTLNIPQIINQI